MQDTNAETTTKTTTTAVGMEIFIKLKCLSGLTEANGAPIGRALSFPNPSPDSLQFEKVPERFFSATQSFELQNSITESSAYFNALMWLSDQNARTGIRRVHFFFTDAHFSKLCISAHQFIH